MKNKHPGEKNYNTSYKFYNFEFTFSSRISISIIMLDRKNEFILLAFWILNIFRTRHRFFPNDDELEFKLNDLKNSAEAIWYDFGVSKICNVMRYVPPIQHRERRKLGLKHSDCVLKRVWPSISRTSVHFLYKLWESIGAWIPRERRPNDST